MHEECGIIGVKAEDTDVYHDIYNGLYTLQHRGQEACGVAIQNGSIESYKETGLVTKALRDQFVEGSVGVGHVLYSNTGLSSLENAQPMVINHRYGSFAIAHNGNLVNTDELKKDLEYKGNIFTTTSDTEVIAQLVAKENVQADSFVEAIRNTMKKLVGSYSLIFLYEDKLIAVRDPAAVRPLCIGKTPTGYIVASESCVIDVLGYEFIRDVKPSEIVVLGDNIETYKGPGGKKAHCMFEYVYFARPDSVIDGKSVYQCRKQLGRNLAKRQPVDADLVAAVPDSGINHAIGYAQESNIQYSEVLIKNRYVGRTFILPEQEDRDVGVKIKLNAIKSQVEGKKVVIVDDSLVRGTTMKRLVRVLRDAGAGEIHVRIACPPLRYPCYYGIDMQSTKEFIASQKTVEEIREMINADSLAYNSIEGLIDAIDIDSKNLCMACLNGEYPLKDKQLNLPETIES